MTRLFKAIFSATIVAIATLTASASNLEELTQKADWCYMHDRYQDALSLYFQIAEEYGTSSDLYYNIGNCYYHNGQPGYAIVYYERALRLNPSNSDARANLEFANSRITDEPGDRGMFISKTVNSIANRISANTWATLALISFVLLLVCIALYVLSTSIPVRKTGFFGAFAMLLLCVVTNVMASIATDYSTGHNEAVVIVPATMLSTSPRAPKDRTEEALLLHEGTKVEILDSISTPTDSVNTKWYDVRVDNDHRAWVRGADVSRI